MKIQTREYALIAGTAKDAEVRSTNSGKTVVSLGVRTKNVKNDSGDWVSEWDNVTCWDECAEIAKTICKGDSVLVAGRLQTRQYTNKNGEQKTTTDIVAEFVQVMGRTAAIATTPALASPLEGFAEVDLSDSEMPF